VPPSTQTATVGGAWFDTRVAVDSEEFWSIIDALPEISRTDSANYTALKVEGRGFGYFWPATQTIGLKQTIAEQRALVGERPAVFEVQFTAGIFGWVVVKLAGIALDELCELVFEAWRLTASAALIQQQGDSPPAF